ncbi:MULTISPECIES: hypothetical protein [unclassified Curtobacterium]|uniref:hypothetical protein n=1 Tax=unclassified Curtobacterium TaxID=257496 RepID=UPI00052A8584|nr:MULTISPECIES: hypothetical protein [unclassified Curtobacterium]AIV41092.1 hypothetical protein NI26_15090 [Curtobacterium sp. MR_MD2014]MBP1302045.1 hypothetical protein [Curtobacterium sp. 1310]
MTSTEERTDAMQGRRGRAGRRAAADSTAGRTPRVDLLPAEVYVERRQRAVTRRAWLGVVVAAAAVVLASGGAMAHQMATAAALTAAQGETTTLLAQQQRYAELRAAERDTDLLDSARAVGGSTEVDWDGTLGGIRDVLPADLAISGMTIASATVTEPFGQPADAGPTPRVATLTLTARSTTIPSVPDWTSRLSGTTGYLDSSISSISYDEDRGEYTSVIELELDARAYDGKYEKDADR